MLHVSLASAVVSCSTALAASLAFNSGGELESKLPLLPADRDELKVLQQEFEAIPVSLFVELIAAVALSLAGEYARSGGTRCMFVFCKWCLQIHLFPVTVRRNCDHAMLLLTVWWPKYRAVDVVVWQSQEAAECRIACLGVSQACDEAAWNLYCIATIARASKQQS